MHFIFCITLLAAVVLKTFTTFYSPNPVFYSTVHLHDGTIIGSQIKLLEMRLNFDFEDNPGFLFLSHIPISDISSNEEINEHACIHSNFVWQYCISFFTFIVSH